MGGEKSEGERECRGRKHGECFCEDVGCRFGLEEVRVELVAVTVSLCILCVGFGTDSSMRVK